MGEKIRSLVYFVGVGVGILGAISLNSFLESKTLIILGLAILGIFFISFAIHEYFKLKQEEVKYE